MSTQPQPRTPYADGCEDYYQAGWRGILPLPPGRKAPVPVGYTGNHGAWPSWPDVLTWADERPEANVALRLPENVIVVDVDAYGSKPGGLVLDELEKTLGALPATWRSTSRDDGRSGIRLFRVPEGLAWPNIFGPGIESIRHGHRYVVAPPSLHPETQRAYRWIDPDGNVALTVPDLEQLPEMPEAWVMHFTGGQLAGEGDAKADLDDEQVIAWIDRYGIGEPCRAMTKHLAAIGQHSGSRHDHYLALTNAALWLAGEGHPGAGTVIAQARAAFLAATAGERAAGEAEREWARMITGGIAISAAKHPDVPVADPCTDPFAGLIDKENQPCPTPPAPPATDAATAPSPTAASPTAEPATDSATFLSLDVSTAGSASPAATDGETPEQRKQRLHDLYVAQERERLAAREDARRAWEADNRELLINQRVERRILDDDVAKIYRERTEPPAPPFDMGTLGEVLARDPEPPMRMKGIVPWDASTLLIAQRKTGKTTAMLNWARSLLTGEAFLGRFETIALEADQSIAMLNFEVSGAQLGRWAHEAGIDPERLFLVNLRGRRNPLSHEGDREALSSLLRSRNVGALIVDPFGRAFTGDNQNDNGQVQSFLVDLDLFTRAEVGARDLMLAAHAGWGAERARGASALEDWADTIITMTRDPQDESRRFLKAEGRDVDIEEDELAFDDFTRTLRLTGNGPRKQGPSKRAQKQEDLRETLLRAILQPLNGDSSGEDRPGCPGWREAARRINADTRSVYKIDVTNARASLIQAGEALAAEGRIVIQSPEKKGLQTLLLPSASEVSEYESTHHPLSGEGVSEYAPLGATHTHSGNRTRDEATGELVDRRTGEVR